MRRREPDGGSPGASEGVGPEEGQGARPSARRGEPATVSGARAPRGGGGGITAAWMAWLRRAADGFPLFGDGPGGWFGVSARIHYRDGQEETLSRRIELSE